MRRARGSWRRVRREVRARGVRDDRRHLGAAAAGGRRAVVLRDQLAAGAGAHAAALPALRARLPGPRARGHASRPRPLQALQRLRALSRPQRRRRLARLPQAHQRAPYR